MGLLSRLRGSPSSRYIPLPTSTPRGSISGGTIPLSKRTSLPSIRLVVLLLGCFLLGHWTSKWGSGGSDGSASVFMITDDKLHRVFDDSNPGVADRSVRPVRAYDAFSDACIEEWVIQHRWGPSCTGTDLSQGTKLDGVWAWVNGSDPAQMASRQAYRPATKLNMDAAHRYADHNELLYSMRSALTSLGPNVLSKMHIMASAYPIGKATLGAGSRMIGQIPAWMKKEATLTTEEKVVLHHDSEYFRPMARHEADPNSEINVEEWRQKTIPSFNSLAVESQLFNLEDNDADQLVYFNDDFFTLLPSSVADFTTPLYGPVLKTLARVTSYYIPSEKPFQRLWNPAGEEVGIKRAAWVLGQRFPMRTLPYITHHPRTLWLPLLREAAQTFPDAFSDTTLARFRAQKEVPTSVQGFFLASWYIVERHREALLWSWIVAKWGGDDGKITRERKEAMWAELAAGGESSNSETIDVARPLRTSSDDLSALKAAGVDAPLNTEYSFSSKDGHALSYLSWMWFWDRPRHGFPDLNSTESKRSVCRLKRSECMPRSTEDASSFFQIIAFGKSECGDCMVAALIGASGESGIEAFMPPAHATIPSAAEKAEPAHLPLTSDWRKTDFSLASVTAQGGGQRGASLRTWCARLVQRYQYVLGWTPSEFFKVETANGLSKTLSSLDEEPKKENAKPGDGRTTFVCLNDDITEDEKGTKRINTMLKSWFESRWPTPMPVEVQ